MDYKLEVVDLTQLPSASSFLSERESVFFQTLKLPKRQAEWLGGRLALKRLVQAQAGMPLKAVEILPHAENGKPQLFIGVQRSHLPFSITHSHGYAVAALAPTDKYIGIDLEKIAPRINAWKRDFFHPTELTGQSDTFLTTLWTQKEALVKLLGTGLAINSYDVRCVQGVPQFFGRALQIYQSLGSPAITVQTRALLPGFAFSVAVGN
ncbi:MAG: 4'-phosphopantetheinyl transferase superfamily protein [Elusimicrobiaceae bacterium]|nr:4'-phosphopantetheinyl transferase superfamily protein [Elusimicrobiaceae bacterium]